MDHNGAPTLVIDGKPRFAMMMMTPWFEHEATAQGQVKLRAEVEAGIELHSTCDELDLGAYDQFWHGPGQYDFGLLDRKLAAIQQFNPNAHIIIKQYVQAPTWWVKRYPEEQVRYASGYEPDHTDDVVIGNFEKDGAFASYASPRWIEDVQAMLRALIKHLTANPLARKVIGLNLLNGHAQEWHYWGSIHELHPDTSPPMTRHFREWLRAKYGNEVARLREAWADPCVSFDTTGVPGLEPRIHTQCLHFRDPQREMPVIDYYRCQHELAADVLIRLCQTVKEFSDNRLLAGAYYGYLFHTPWYPDGQSLGLGRVLASPHVDFLAAPANYNDWLSRGVGGDALPRGLPESCKAHGKLYITESDEGTYKANKVHRPCEAIENWGESIANLRKQFCQVLIRNTGHWWWDWDAAHGLYIHPEHIQALRSFKEIAEISLHLDRRSNSEVAVVFNLDTYYHTAQAVGGPNWDLLDLVPHVLSRSGVPFDLLSLDDIDCAGLPEYKLYIFPDCSFTTAAQRQRIHRTLAARHATALWVYAPGFVDGDRLSTEAMRELTGIRLRAIAATGTQEIRLTPATHPLTRDFKPAGSIMRVELPGLGKGNDNRVVRCERNEDFRFGSRHAILGPTFVVDDAEAAILGHLVSVNAPGLAIKELAGWHSIYSAAIPTSTALLRRIFKLAGVHCYHERDDVLMIGRHFFCFASRDDHGPREVRLPVPTDVYDVFGRQWLATQTDRVTVELKARSTQLYYYGSREAFEQATALARDQSI